jgi:hypothetical protein
MPHQAADILGMSGGGAQGAQEGQVKHDGSFEIWRPNPGKYIIRVQYDSGDVTASGGVEVKVGDADENGGCVRGR